MDMRVRKRFQHDLHLHVDVGLLGGSVRDERLHLTDLWRIRTFHDDYSFTLLLIRPQDFPPGSYFTRSRNPLMDESKFVSNA